MAGGGGFFSSNVAFSGVQIADANGDLTNLTANTIFASNLNVIGDFVTMNTITSNTERVDISNSGTGPALKVTQGVGIAAETALTVNQESSGNILQLQQSGVTKVSVQENGFVGIGTAAPQSALDVIGSIKATTSIMSDTQFLGQANDAASAPSFSFAANPDTGIFQPIASNLALSTGGIERFRVSSNGFVGIGTSSPTSALDVIGSASISSNLVVSGNITASNIRVLGDYVILDTITSNTEQMVITNDGTGPALKVTQTGVNSIAEFYDDENALAFKVANDGLVGIGTANPLAKLHVVGSIKATTSISSDTQFLGKALDTEGAPSFSFTANPNTGIFQPATSNIAVSTGGTERLRVSSNGFIGIGTTIPQSTLDVIGSIKATGSILSDTQFLGQANDTASAPSFSFVANPDTGIFQPAVSNIALSTGGTERLRVSSNGNVGIGTTTPQTALDVIGSTSISSNLVVSGNITASNIRVLGDYVILDTITSNTEQMVITNNGTGPALKVTQTGMNSIAEFYDDDNALALKVANNGLVGIGTSDPLEKLHVVGSIKATTSIMSDTQFLGQAYDMASSPSFSFTANPDTGIFQPATSNLAVSTGGTERLRVSSNGNVGIGTVTPQNKLDVIGSIKATASISSDTQFLGQAGDTAGAPSFSFAANPNTGIFQPAVSNIALSTGGTERLRVSSNGFVGIGTVDPQSALHVIGSTSISSNLVVSGNITASNIRVLGDYVILDTITSNTEQMVITNDGTGPALKVTQTGANSIAEFYDDGNVLALKVANNGLVGIGTSDPQSTLHITGTTRIDGNATVQGSTSMTYSGTAAALTVNQQGTGKLFELQYAGTPQFVVLDGGNVGIGTSPQSSFKLDVIGNASITGNTLIGSLPTTNQHTIRGSVYQTYSGTETSLTVDSKGTGKIFELLDSAQPVMTVLDGGNVGIGTATPQSTLHVNGSALISTNLTVSGGEIKTSAAVSSTLFSDTTTGSIAIGGGLTTGTVTLGATGSTGVVSLFPATGAQAITLGGATSGLITLGSTTASAVQLPTGKTKVGTTTLVQGGAISVTLPAIAGTLIVLENALTSGTTNAGFLKYNGTTAAAGQLDGGTTTPTGTTRLNYGGYIYSTAFNVLGTADTATAATHYFVETSSDGFVRPKTLANARTELVTTAAVNSAAATTVGTITSGVWNAGAVTSSGNISSATQFLGKSGDLVSAPSFSWTGNTTMGIYRPAANEMGIVTNGIERMRVNASGNVGINSTSPTSKLDIFNTTIANTSDDMVGLIYDANWNLKIQQQHIAGSHIQYDIYQRYNATNIHTMTLKGGNVGIGTTNPQAKLHVQGSMFINSYYILPTFLYDGSSSTKPSLSGWHLNELRKLYNLPLVNGLFWIKSPAMPSALQMYVNFTADGGGYDFYRITNNANTTANYTYSTHGGRALGLDVFYPRSQGHWAAIYDYVVNVNQSTIANDVKTTGAIMRKITTVASGTYTTLIMRDPRYYDGGAPDWEVPDGGKWFLRNTVFGEPNGDYLMYAYLSLYSVSANGDEIGFNDGNAYATLGSTFIASTNVKGSSVMYF